VPRLTKHLVNGMLPGMVSFNIYEAKTQLSKLIRQVRAGEEVIIADAGIPVAKLVPIEPPKTARVLGADRGKIWTAPDAFEPLGGEDLAAWDGALFPESHPPTQRPPGPARARRQRARRKPPR
jgi:prevent-host-death family protein